MICEKIYIHLSCLDSHFCFIYLSDHLPRSFYRFWVFFANKVTTGTNSIFFLIVKIMLELALSLPFTDKAMILLLEFNSTFLLISSISSDPKKLLTYFNRTATVVFLKIAFISSPSVFPNNVSFYLKYLKAILSAISALTLLDSSLKQDHKLSFVSE